MTDNTENKSTRCNDVLSQSTTQNNQESNDINADLSINVASVNTDLEMRETYLQVSQQTQANHSVQDHSFFQLDLPTLGETLIRAKQLQDGQVPKDLHCNLAETKGGDLNNFWEPSEAEQCASMSTPTTDVIPHHRSQDVATMPPLTVPSRPPRPLVLPAPAKNSIRRHYASPKPQETASGIIDNSIVYSFSRQSNRVNNTSLAQSEDLLVAIPVEEDEVHVYAVNHDVSHHEVYKQIRMARVRRISCRLYFIFFVLVAAAAMIASIVVIKKNTSDIQEQETEAELTWLHNMMQYNPQGQLIVSIMGADAMLLNDASSLYVKALTWLLRSSGRNDSQEMTSTLAQRFYLASFYFDTTTDVDKWTACNPPNQTCTDPYTNITYQAWLSDSHECEWAGVRCDSQQQITCLELYDMNLVGTIPSCTAKFPFLQKLALWSTQLKGNISFLSDCPHLTVIDFNNSSLTGDLSSVWQHRKLAYFSVENNSLTGSLSSQVGNLVDLNVLSLLGNKLTGTVPSEIGCSDSVTYFNIGDNFFQGRLPPSMQFWSMIQVFDVSRNSFSGLIPKFLGQFNATLLELNLYDNSFAGTLPDELFHLSELIMLDVSKNELRGTLDARFASLQQNLRIQELGLSGNYFSGTIPTELGLLADLDEIYLQGNDFTGSVPASLCQQQSLNRFKLVADCAKDVNGQAELQCNCCTVCCQAGGTQCRPS